jgi:hypothetical protein
MPNRKRDDGYTITRRNGHDGQIWGQPVEVPRDRVQNRTPTGTWTRLACDLMLRLERTNEHKAIAVPFADADYMTRARNSLYKWFRERYGPFTVDIVLDRSEDGSGTLYICRGPKWGCYPVKELEELNE